MKNILQPPSQLALDEINRRAINDPLGFIQEETARFATDVRQLADDILAARHDRLLIMLAGPSSSGKTTTASMLCDGLHARGVETHTVSIDDFYRGRGQAPILPDGSYDYEALEALDVPEMLSCLQALLETGEADLPQYDFMSGKPHPEKRHLKTSAHAAIIFEGIHAVNPIFEQHIARERMIKLFVNPMRRFYDGEETLLARRQTRLVRRILRDNRFRNSPPANTLKMWKQVVRGERQYMFPFVDTVDYAVDTTHAFEPCVYRKEFLELMESLPTNHPSYELAKQLQDAVAAFAEIPVSAVPTDCLLREFLGSDRG